jgi:hypothetical protein
MRPTRRRPHGVALALALLAACLALAPLATVPRAASAERAPTATARTRPPPAAATTPSRPASPGARKNAAHTLPYVAGGIIMVIALALAALLASRRRQDRGAPEPSGSG